MPFFSDQPVINRHTVGAGDRLLPRRRHAPRPRAQEDPAQSGQTRCPVGRHPRISKFPCTAGQCPPVARNSDCLYAGAHPLNPAALQVPVVGLIKGLPLHIVGCLVATNDAEDSPLPPELDRCQHASHAFTLLTTLSPIFAPVAVGPGVMGPDQKFHREFIDAVNLALLAVAGPEADAMVSAASRKERFHTAMNRAALVSTALTALGLIMSALAPSQGSGRSSGLLNWGAVCEAALSHPRGAVILEASIEATRTLVRAVRAAACSDAVEGSSVFDLAFHAGSSMENLTEMLATPLFYQSLVLRDPACLGPMRLVITCLSMHDAPLAPPPLGRDPNRGTLVPIPRPRPAEKAGGAMELLCARGLAMVLVLAEYGGPDFLESVKRAPAAAPLAEEFVQRIAQYANAVLLRPRLAAFPPSPFEGQMAINVLRAIELLADDGSFRGPLALKLAPAVSLLLSNHPHQFASLWCIGETAIQLMAKDSILINSCTKNALEGVRHYADASNALRHTASPAGLSPEEVRLGRQLALERAVLLAKALINFHVFSIREDVQPLKQDEFMDAVLDNLTSEEGAMGGPESRLTCALTNLERLEEVTAKFGGEYPIGGHEIMADVDIRTLNDIVEKVRARRSIHAALAQHVANGSSAGQFGGAVTEKSGQGMEAPASPRGRSRPQMLKPGGWSPGKVGGRGAWAGPGNAADPHPSAAMPPPSMRPVQMKEHIAGHSRPMVPPQQFLQQPEPEVQMEAPMPSATMPPTAAGPASPPAIDLDVKTSVLEALVAFARDRAQGQDGGQ